MNQTRSAPSRLTRPVVTLCLALLLIVSMAFPALALSADGTNLQKVRAAKDGVVRILTYCDGNMIGLGSGFAIGKPGKETRYFITNWHVVYDDNAERISNDVFILLDDQAAVDTGKGLRVDESHMMRCKVLGSPRQYPDFAILQAEATVSGRKALALSKLDTVESMDPVYAMGFPSVGDEVRGDGIIASTNEAISNTSGTVNQVSKVAGFGGYRYIVHSAEIHHGNSGGPLLNGNGAVVGLNTYGTEIDDGGSAAVHYYSVPIDYVIDELDRLGIEYALDNPLPGWVIYAAIGGGALALVAVIFALMLRSQTNKLRQQMEQMEQLAAQQAQQPVQQTPQPVMQQPQQFRPVPQFVQQPGNPAQPSPARTPAAKAPVSSNLLRLVGISGQYAGRRFAIPVSIALGTDPSKNHLAFKAGTPGVSRRHCEVINKNGKLYLVDHGSSYGTFFHGSKLPPRQPVELTEGERFYIGSKDICFRIERSSRA